MKNYLNFTKINIVILGVLLFVPKLVSADTVTWCLFGDCSGSSSLTISDIILLMVELINQAVVIVAALALLFFFFGLSKFILQADNEEKRREGKNIMTWGIIALFVMFSVWSLVFVLRDTFFG